MPGRCGLEHTGLQTRGQKVNSSLGLCHVPTPMSLPSQALPHAARVILSSSSSSHAEGRGQDKREGAHASASILTLCSGDSVTSSRGGGGGVGEGQKEREKQIPR
uniref:Uncharacterized protein n=1 Tax=Mustela putorius furo TaxID=9669 RepID=M3YG77_MUSPF